MELFASYTGFDFLVFYAVMLLTCVGLGVWIPANLRPEGKRRAPADLEEIAVLTGGPRRHAYALLADLFAKGALEDAGKGRLRVVDKNVDASGAGRSILGQIGALQFNHVLMSLISHAKRVEGRLMDRGLLMDQGQRLQLGALSILPYVVLFGIGLYRERTGAAEGEPTGILIFLLIVTVCLAGTRLFKPNPRTRAGNEAVLGLKEENSRIRRAPDASEAGLAVAIFGTGVLVGTPWHPVHAAGNPAFGFGGTSSGGCGGGGFFDTDSGGGGSSGDSGGGGGCGGGCGGCGG